MILSRKIDKKYTKFYFRFFNEKVVKKLLFFGSRLKLCKINLFKTNVSKMNFYSHFYFYPLLN